MTFNLVCGECHQSDRFCTHFLASVGKFVVGRMVLSHKSHVKTPLFSCPVNPVRRDIAVRSLIVLLQSLHDETASHGWSLQARKRLTNLLRRVPISCYLLSCMRLLGVINSPSKSLSLVVHCSWSQWLSYCINWGLKSSLRHLRFEYSYYVNC